MIHGLTIAIKYLILPSTNKDKNKPVPSFINIEDVANVSTEIYFEGLDTEQSSKVNIRIAMKGINFDFNTQLTYRN